METNFYFISNRLNINKIYNFEILNELLAHMLLAEKYKNENGQNHIDTISNESNRITINLQSKSNRSPETYKTGRILKSQMSKNLKK